MGQKSRKIFCVVLNCRENFLLSLCDPKFYPSPRAILGSTSLFEAFFPPSGKSRCPCVSAMHTKSAPDRYGGRKLPGLFACGMDTNGIGK